MYLRPVSSENEKIQETKPLVLSSATENFLRRCYDYLKQKNEKTTGVTISVDEVSSRLASFYERIRKVVDWKEEHLMRRIAIERVLKRKLFLRKHVKGAGEETILELIRGGHFPNDFIKKSKIDEVQKLIEKYKFILENNPPLPKEKTKSQFYDQIFELAACELEEILDALSYQKVYILIEYMKRVMDERIAIEKRAKRITGIGEKEKEIQIHIAVCQALLKLDKSTITYVLLKKYYPQWFDYREETIKDIARNVHFIFRNIDKHFSHILADRFYGVCEIYNTPFLLLGDIFLEDSQKIKREMFEPSSLKEEIFQAYKKRLSTLKKRLYRSAFYSTSSVFLTNVFSLYIIEIPFTRLVTGKFCLVSALVDVFVPTFLMAALVSTIRLPSKNNFNLVIEEVDKIVYQNDKIKPCEVGLYPQKSFLLKAFFGFIYFLSFIICLGLIVLFLYKIHFPTILSYAIFIIFTSLIFFIGSLIRKRARELHMTREKETLLSFIIDPFTLPIIHFGKWLSSKWKKYNMVGIFFTILIDTPFVLFVKFLEQWRYFLKEKKGSVH